jgi:hypothetical protein
MELERRGSRKWIAAKTILSFILHFQHKEHQFQCKGSGADRLPQTCSISATISVCSLMSPAVHCTMQMDNDDPGELRCRNTFLSRLIGQHFPTMSGSTPRVGRLKIILEVFCALNILITRKLRPSSGGMHRPSRRSKVTIEAAGRNLLTFVV